MIQIPRIAWDALRFVLVAIGGVMVSYGWINAEDVEPLADKIIEIIGGALMLIGAGWWLIVLIRSRNAVLVPVTVVKELDLPVVSPATGKVVNSENKN